MTRHAGHPWRVTMLALMTCVFANAVPAHASDVDECIVHLDHEVPFTGLFAVVPGRQATSITGGNACLGAPSDGMVTLHLPGKGKNIDDVAALRNLDDYRWGAINAKGELTVLPMFLDLGQFHHGLATAFDGKTEKWGYVDTRGNWAIEPQFDAVYSFSDVGVAAVRKGRQWLLIDHSGKALSLNLGANIDWISVSDASPARVRVHYNPSYLDAAGKNLSLPRGMNLLQPFGDKGLAVATLHGHMGIVDADFRWVLPARYGNIMPPAKGSTMGAARQFDDVVLLKIRDGHIVPTRVDDARRIGTLWLTVNGDDKYAILGRDGNPLLKLDGREAFRLRRVGNFLIDRHGADMRVVGPAFTKALTLSGDVEVNNALADDLLGVTKDGKTDRLITANGTVIDAHDAGNWVTKVVAVKRHGKQLWLVDADGRVLDIVNGKGALLLHGKARKMLADHHPEPVSSDDRNTGDAPFVIAVLNPGEHGKGAGFLWSDGKARLNQAGQAVHPLGTAAVDRYAFKTDKGVGMTDVAGNVLIPAGVSDIGSFVDGHAVVTSDDGVQITDMAGNLVAVPDAAEVEILGPTRAGYKTGTAADAPWGLFDIDNGKVIAEPAFRSIGPYVGDGAVAVAADGKAGVIDRQGQWLLSPRYASVSPLNGNVWLVRRAASGSVPDDDDTTKDGDLAVVARDGRVVAGYAHQLQAERRDDGRVAVTIGSGTKAARLLIGADGKIIVRGGKASFTQVGPWLKVRARALTGYLGKHHQWVRPLQESSPLVAADGHALERDAGTTRIVNGQGQLLTALPAGRWYWPNPSDGLIGRVSSGKGLETRYVDDNGKPMLTVHGFAGPFKQGLALLDPRGDGHVQWVDRKGNVIDPGSFADLGLPASNGLAFASDGNGYGFIDKRGRYAIPPVYDTVSSFDGGVAVVANDHQAMLINATGQPLARVAVECGVRVLFDSRNHRVWPETLPKGCAR